MISWKEKIKMRALKEESVMCQSIAAMPVEFYQQVMEMGLKKLNEQERKIIFLRFLEALPIARVADVLGFTWEQTDSLIDEAVKKLSDEMSRLLEERQQISRPQFQSA